MEIIAHRGVHDASIKANSWEALKLARTHGFGLETDIRDLLGDVVVSHDPPKGDLPDLRQLLDIYIKSDLTLALNIKADGLAKCVARECGLRGMKNYFVFDMSIPDTLSQLSAGNPVYLRRSEYESASPLQERAAGVWLDGLEKPLPWRELLESLLLETHVCVVSEELHGRAVREQWRDLSYFKTFANLRLCTDLPFEAREFFDA